LSGGPTILDHFALHDHQVVVEAESADQDDEIAVWVAGAWYEEPPALEPGHGTAHALARLRVIGVNVVDGEADRSKGARTREVHEFEHGDLDLVEDTLGVGAA